MNLYKLLAGLMTLGVIVLFSAQWSLSRTIRTAREDARPANLDLTIITPLNCTECFDATRVRDALATQPVVLNERAIAYPSPQADELIAAHQLTALPAVLVSGETSKANIAPVLTPQTRQSGDTLVWTNLPPPYVDLADGNTKGRVTLTLLTDKRCADCYDTKNHETILKSGFGMSLTATESVDLSSARGQELKRMYNITSVPTAIISPDASVYPSFVKAWTSVGSTEPDGSFVFRKLAVMGPYFDLKNGTIVKPQTP